MVVTVIITTYKRPSLLTYAAASVVNQTLPAEFELELIIADDDPQGSALTALQGLSGDLSASVRIIYVKRSNGLGGVARSRNRALALATGEWVLFLDDDDRLLPRGMEALLARLTADKTDFCAGNFERVIEDVMGKTLHTHVERVAWSKNDLHVKNLFPIGSYLIRKRSIQVLFNPQLQTHEDWLFLLDNITDLRVSICDTAVVQIRLVHDNSRIHRNEVGGQKQKAEDYTRIYALHPAPELATNRLRILHHYGGTSLESLLGLTKNDALPWFEETANGIFLCSSANGRSQSGLNLSATEVSVVNTISEVMQSLTRGIVLDIGANDGAITIPLARTLPDQRIISAEADLVTFMHLCSNLMANQLQHVVPIYASQATDASIESTELTKKPRHYRIKFEVDKIASKENISLIRFLKLEDCADTLKYCIENLKTNNPCIYIRNDTCGSSRDDQLLAINFLFPLGYQIFTIQDDFYAYHPSVIPQEALFEKLAAKGFGITVGDH
jgi:FkbM family methyltransferase